MSTPLSFRPAAEVAADVADGTLSPVEVVEAYLDRIAARRADVTAYVTVLEERAREAAREAERAVERGDDLGPLHGLPVAVKDVDAKLAGVRHTYGSTFFADHVAEETAAVVRRLQDAGAIVVGKSNTPEFAHRAKTENDLVGVTATPFDLDRNAGGSSGGSAAAVADGQAALAQGSDAGGSVRIPSACCGVYGLKPSFGRIPCDARPNAFGMHTPFIDRGIHARTVADAALMLEAIAGPHSRDPFSLPEPTVDYRDALAADLDGVSVAYSPDLDVFQVGARIREVVDDAVTAFADAGADVHEISVDFGHSWSALIDGSRRPAMQVQAASFVEDLEREVDLDLLGEHRDEFTDTYVSRVEAGREYDAVAYKQSDVVRTAIFDEFARIFGEHDLLVAPTLGALPFPNDAPGPAEINGSAIDPLSEWFLTWPVNATGQPAASIPAGFVDGLPVGMQVIGRRFADDDVLAASAAFERERPWFDAYLDLV